jgi:hypothetical protein
MDGLIKYYKLLKIEFDIFYYFAPQYNVILLLRASPVGKKTEIIINNFSCQNYIIECLYQH